MGLLIASEGRVVEEKAQHIQVLRSDLAAPSGDAATVQDRGGAVLEALFLVTLQETGNPAPLGERQRRPHNVD